MPREISYGEIMTIVVDDPDGDPTDVLEIIILQTAMDLSLAMDDFGGGHEETLRIASLLSQLGAALIGVYKDETIATERKVPGNILPN